jgi:phytoene synthase
MKNENEVQQITLKSKSNFLYSFFLLPKEKRKAIYTLYAFCRQTDDIADNLAPAEKRMHQLNIWENELKKCFMKSVSNYFETLKQVMEKFRIPFEHFLELIAGVRMDITNFKYHSFEDLKLYCYRVASTVGLMCIQIFGYRDPLIKSYAENLGIALQLTNIIRDVGADSKMGRLYLPDNDIKAYNVSEKDILNHKYSDEFFQLMKHQATRAREYYQKADDCLSENELRNMLVSEIMKNIYFTLLEKIENHNFQVLDKKIRLSSPQKVYITLNTLLNVKFAG